MALIPWGADWRACQYVIGWGDTRPILESVISHVG